MDWPRAKAILIAAFLALDLMLALELWVGQAGAPLAQAPGRVRDDLLREGIVFTGSLPGRRPPAMRRLKVRARPADAARLRASFFPGALGPAGPSAPSSAGEAGAQPGAQGAPGAGDRQGALVFRREGEQLTILPQGLILYERRDLAAGEPPVSFDLAAARQVGEDFVRRRGLLPADARPDYAVPVPGGRPGAYQVFYVQRFHEWPLFGGYLGMEVVYGSVRALEAFWLDVEGFVGPRRPVITAEQALRALARALSARRVPGAAGAGGAPPGAPAAGERLVVERVELGYAGFLQPGAAQWEAVPVWRVLSRDGHAFYVNAYLGTLEESP